MTKIDSGSPETLPAKQVKRVFVKVMLFMFTFLPAIISPAKLFAAAPSVTSFSPVSGAVGTLVTIHGANLSAPTALTIGGQSAILLSNTGSTLVAMVMPGAVTGKVSITTTGGTVSSSSSFAVTATQFPVAQQGPALPATGTIGISSPGHSVAISADGNTAIAGSFTDNKRLGATWAFVRNGGVWAQQAKFAGLGATGTSKQGTGVAVSADGNTAVVGGNGDNGGIGAMWVFVRSGGAWIQQGAKLVGTGAVGASAQGTVVSVSADRNTAISGGNGDNGGIGAAWVFTRTGTNWTQQGPKLVGTSSIGAAGQGGAVSLSADGNTIIIGGDADNSATGAAWVFTRSGSTWTQQGSKLVGTDITGSPALGASVSLSADGNTAMIGGDTDNSGIGAAWVFTRSGGVWVQQGLKLVGTGAQGAAQQGSSVSLSADGNTAAVGADDDHALAGAIWVYTRNGGVWAQQGTKFASINGQRSDQMGTSLSLSANGAAVVTGGVNFRTLQGQAWVFAASSNASLSSINLTPVSVLTNTGTVGSTTTYTTSVGYATASVTVTPVTADPTATVTVNSVAVTSGTASAPIALAAGANTTITTKVTAGDGATTMTYSIVVTRALSPNASLTAIKLSPLSTLINTGTVGATTTYTGTIGNTIPSVTVTPTAADVNATIKVNGIAVASGAASGPIALPGGQGAATTITIIVTAQDGTTTHTYSITVTHAISADPLLSGLKLNGGATLTNTGTTGSTTTYAASVTSSHTSVTVTPTTEDPTATVTVNGTAVTSGTPSGPVAIAPGTTTTITVAVTAQNGTTTHTYLVTVSPGTDILTSIALTPSSALVNTGTAGEVTTYTTRLSSTTASVTITPIAQDPTATIKVNGIAVASGTASGPIAIAFGQTTINTVVTAQNGTTTRTYAIIVTRLATNALLSTIKLNPASALTNTGTVGNTTSYTTPVSNATTSVSVTPTTEDPNATVTVNGAAVISGTPSESIALAEGATTTITTVVTAQDGMTTRIYSVAVTRAPSADASLATVLVDLGGFMIEPGGSGFTAGVTYATTTVNVMPTSNDPNAIIKVNGVAVASGTPATIPLAPGPNTIDIVATSQDGSATTTYPIVLTRLSNNALLSVIKLTPASALTNTGTSGNTTTYTTSVSNAITSVTVTPTTQDPNATVTVNNIAVIPGTASGSIPLPEGVTTVIITQVTSQDGSATHVYLIDITSPPSRNASLSTIALTPAAALTNTGTTGTTTTYTTSVPNTTASVTVTPTAQDPTATINVNGTAVTSGTASGAIALAVGNNTITIIATAQDGITTHTYSIAVTRAPSSNALLSIIKITPASVLTNTGTTGTTTNYTTTTASSTTSVTITPTAQDPTATIKVNGTAVASGTASGSIAIPIGQTIVTIVATAQDGTTTHTYSITVTRLSNNALLSVIKLTPASALTNTGTTGTTTTYTTSVSNATTSVTVTATAQDANATIKVNGTTVASGTASGSIALAVGTNTITTIVTAQDGTTTRTYAITVARAAGPIMSLYTPIGVEQPINDLTVENDGVMVHQGVSPNGDGLNDYLHIDGLAAYQDNKLTIIDRRGATVFESKGYNNISKVFDGDTGNGRMLKPGTYFYSLDYVAEGKIRHKTGFIILRY